MLFKATKFFLPASFLVAAHILLVSTCSVALAQRGAKLSDTQQKAREAPLALDRQRQAEAAARRAEEERRRLQAALEIERQRQAEEAEQRRQEELERARILALDEMNEREIIQHLQRTGAWTITHRRAKEAAAQRALEEAKAKIEQLLNEATQPSTESLAPKQVLPTVPSDALPAATDSISRPAIQQTRESIPEAEPLPLEEEDMSSGGPTAIDPSSATGSIGPEQSALDPAENTEEDQTQQRRKNQIEANWLERLERMIKLSPASPKKEPILRKRYNFNR